MLDSSRLRKRVLKMPTRPSSRPSSHLCSCVVLDGRLLLVGLQLVRCQRQSVDGGHDLVVQPAVGRPQVVATVCSCRSGKATGLPLIVAFG